ncbi:hypothetical protein [Kitasatospora sp. NPDC057223]|uniref:hypothetical protein n=1 Tax=Kitasatospora sp. NPDC057223 TaxID=3346055 RepID=UPI00362A1394
MALFRRSGRPSQVPSWCAWFSPAEWQAFSEAVTAFVQDSGSEPVEIGPEQTIRLGSTEGIRYPVDLATLAAREHRLPRKQWRADVARYLALHRDAAAQWQRLSRADFAEARSLLMPKIFRADALPDEESVTREVGHELAAAAVLRMNGGVYLPTREQIGRWGVSEDELWNTALRNLGVEACETERGGSGASPSVVVTGPGEFGSAQVLRAAELLGHPAPHGFLAATPSEDTVVLVVIDGPGLHTSAAAMEMYGRQLWEQSEPQLRLSPGVLWVHEGRIESVGVELPAKDGSRPGVITGSQRFVDLLESF